MTEADDYAVLQILNNIEAESSRAEKEELVRELVATQIGAFVVKWTYDPFVTFGIRVGRRDPDLKPKVALPFKTAIMEPILHKLSTRQLTGLAAEREIGDIMAYLSAPGAELLFRILSKDLKCGIAESTINSAVPDLVPVFCVMRAHEYEEKRIKKWPVAVEPKLDGFRYTFICRNGNGGFFTRSGKRAPSVDHMVEPILEVAKMILLAAEFAPSAVADLLRGGSTTGELNFVLDGEMLAGETFNDTSAALRRESAEATEAKFHIFDMMTYGEFDAVGSVSRTYADRRKYVDVFVAAAKLSKHADKLTKTPRYLAASFEEVMSYYNTFRSRGYEGAMVKLMDGFYDKKKSHSWLKLKNKSSEDLPVVGAYPGEPHTKYENCLGGLIVRRENGVEVRVGGGFSDEERLSIWELWVCDSAPIHTAAYQPQLLGRLLEVEFHEETPDGSLRHPRAKCFRDDKANEVESKEAA